MVRFGLIDPGKATNYAAEVIGAYAVKATGPGALAGSLSGGNLQKFIMGREILQRPEALVVSPADVGSGRGRGGRHPSGDRRSRRARLGGHGHLARPRRMLTLCDTIAVINLGRLSAPMKVGAGLDRGDRPAHGRRARRPHGDGRNDRGPACASGLKSG